MEQNAHPCPSFSSSPSFVSGQGEFAEGMYPALPVLGKLLQGEFCWQAPMIYRRLVKKSKTDAYESVHGGGSYFDCISPDVFTAYINPSSFIPPICSPNPVNPVNPV